MYTFFRKSLLIALATISITSCDSDIFSNSEELTLDKACEADKQFCDEIKADSWCRNDRKEMIISRYKVESTKDKKFAYDALINTEKYIKCAELSKLIEYKDVDAKYADIDKGRTKPLTEKEIKERAAYADSVERRKNDKVVNYRLALIELDRLETWTSFSSIPELAHYHWTRHQNKEAIKKLVNLDEQGKLNISWLQYAISQHYISYDRNKTINALHKSLVLYPPSDYEPKKETLEKSKKHNPFDDNGHIYFDVLRGLASINFSDGNYAASYAYAKLLIINNDKTADLDMIIEYIDKNKRNKKSALDDLADELHDLMGSGKLTSQYLDSLEKYKL